MNSCSSPGTFGNRPSRQSRLACSILARELETKFQKMCRSPSMRRAADEGHPGVADGTQCYRSARRKHQHTATLRPLVTALDAAADDVGRALLVLVGKRQLTACRHGRIDVEKRRQRPDGRRLTESAAGEHADSRAGDGDGRQVTGGVMMELGVGLLVLERQRDPELQSVDARARLARARSRCAPNARCRGPRSSS